MTPLYKAAKNGDLEKVKQLLAEGTPLRGEYDIDSPLTVACEGNYSEIVRLLLESGDSISYRNYEATGAARLGNTEALKVLLEFGLDPDASGKHEGQLLDIAAENGHTETVQLLLEKGASVNGWWEREEYEDGFEEVVISESGCMTPLQSATYYGHGGVVEVLMAAGADLWDKTPDFYREQVEISRLRVIEERRRQPVPESSSGIIESPFFTCLLVLVLAPYIILSSIWETLFVKDENRYWRP